MSLVSASIVGFDLDFVRHAMRFCAMRAVPRDALADAA
jgi:hypothetical protein